MATHMAEGSNDVNPARTKSDAADAKSERRTVTLLSSIASLPNPGCCYIPRRYIVTILTFLAFAVMYGIRSNLSVAIVLMTSNTTVIVNGKEKIRPAPFHWNSVEQGTILSAFFYGYIVTQIPGGWLAAHFGGKYVVLIGTLGAAVFTLLAPPAADLGKTFLIIALVLQGVFQGVLLPAMHAILGTWALKKEKTLMSAIVYAGLYFGTVVALLISSYLGDLSWSAIFYFFGGVGVVFCVLWLFVFADKPEDMRGISKQELALYKQEKSERGEHLGIPWLHIFLSKEIWTIVVCHFCQNYGFYAMLTQLPEILGQFLFYSYHTASSLSSLPHLAMGCSLTFGGPLVDYLRAHCKWMTTTRCRKIFCCCGFIGAALTNLLATANTYSSIRFIGIILSLGFSGFTFMSICANMLDVAPQYAGHIMGLSNTLATVPGIIEPIIVGEIVTDALPSQWRIVFYTITGVYLFGSLQYFIFGTGEVLSWARKRDTTVQSSPSSI